eukprot:7479896-Karenia_brevis.AAC.1
MAFEKTCEFLQDVGAKISAHKSKLFSTSPQFRSWLQERTWAYIDTTVPVVANFRDLGSNVSLTKSASTSVSRERLAKAIITVRRISWLPHQLSTKAMFLRASALAQGLYACEASSVDEVMIRQFTKHIVQMLQKSAYQPSNALVFTLAGVGDDLDPSIIILLRRAIMARRMIAKHPELMPIFRNIIEYYHSIEHKGVMRCVQE